MTYNTIATMAEDYALNRRIVAAVAEEDLSNPTYWTSLWHWTVVSQPGWAAAWESAVASGVTDPGYNETVITDGMILSAVQYVISLHPEPDTEPEA
jgi:hypothetical protein